MATVKHIVFFKLKDGAGGRTREQNAREAKQRLESLRGKIPGLRHIEVGIDFDRSAAAYDIALTCELESRAALDAYQKHPLHQEAAAFVTGVRESRAVVDYEVG